MSRTKFRHEKFRFIQCLCGFSALFEIRAIAVLSSKEKERRKSALKSPLESSRGGFYFAEYARNCADFVGATLLENLPRASTGPRSGLNLGQRPSPLRAPVQSFALFFAHFSSSPQILLRFSELFLVPPHAAAQSQEDA